MDAEDTPRTEGPRDWKQPRRRPAWWPEGEAWPPKGPPGGGHWQGMRGRFLRRAGCAFFVLFVLFSGLSAVFFWLLNRLSAGSLAENVPTVLLVGGVALACILTFITAVRRTVIPISNLLDAAGRIAGGDYAARVPARGPGEVRGLARAFNSMAERLQVHDQQRRAMLADVSHELRTPLTVLQGQLEGMLDGIYPADREHLETALEETHVLERMIEDLRTLSLAEAGALKLALEPTDLAALVEEAASAFQPEAARRSVTLRTTAQPGLPGIEVDPTRIRQVLSNLLSNALRYTPAGGTVQVRVEADGAGARVTVQDSGSGIAPEDLAHIFDRFYKSADSRGSGLGLPIARNLVAVHGGEMSAESTPGQGTAITFRLPDRPEQVE